jgi:3-isopropylmalate/(R)-2-methylmalate dehydratase small subunit
MPPDSGTMTGASWVFGDEVNTDVLAPGQYMSGSIGDLAAHCLERVDAAFAANVRPGDIVVAGENFGVGSSREQAVEVLRALGVGAVVAKSFGGIFFRNAYNLGLYAIVCEAADQIQSGDTLSVNAAAGKITVPSRNLALTCDPVPAFLLDMAERGGLIASLEARLSARGGENNT